MHESPAGLTFTKAVKKYITEAAKWAKFIAIVSFILWLFTVLAIFEAITGLPVLSLIIPGSHFNLDAGVFLNVVAFLFILTGFFPIMYLYKFSMKIKKNISTATIEGIEDAFENLKSFFKFYGVFIGILLGLYAFIILVAFVNQLIK